MYVCMYVCMYVRMYVCTYVCNVCNKYVATYVFSPPLHLPRSLIQPSIEKSLSEFQQKRLMGLGWMFGDQKLSDTMAPDEVAEAVYSTLLPHIRDIM